MVCISGDIPEIMEFLAEEGIFSEEPRLFTKILSILFKFSDFQVK
jgi:hypothetical protein